MHTSIQLDSPIEIINLTPLNPLISRCQIKVCYVGEQPNRNRSIITKDVARQLANSLPGSPIVGFYNEAKGDFEEHNKVIDISNGQLKLKDKTKPYGFIDLGAKAWFAKYLDDNQVEREYLVTEGFLWTGQYPECARIIKEGNNQSMELDPNTIQAFWTKQNNEMPKFFIINEAIISKLCILGKDMEPCFEGANITAPTIQFSFDDGFKAQLLDMMNELKDLMNKGGKKMFTKFSVEIGSTLWDALYSYVAEHYSEYSIEGIYEEEDKKFSVLAFDGKYYRLNFSIAKEDEFNFDAELVELESYTPDEQPQFSQEDINLYVQKKNEDKKGQEENDKNHNNVKGDEEKCPKCNKPIKECTCKEDTYTLSEIPEYVELETKFTALSNDYDTLKDRNATLEAENLALLAFKAGIEKKEKEAMIASFCMLSNEDKADVIANIDSYSLDDIEAKLSILCVRNKVNFSFEEKEPAVVHLDSGMDDEDAMAPAWVKAAMKVAKTMN